MSYEDPSTIVPSADSAIEYELGRLRNDLRLDPDAKIEFDADKFVESLRNGDDYVDDAGRSRRREKEVDAIDLYFKLLKKRSVDDNFVFGKVNFGTQVTVDGTRIVRPGYVQEESGRIFIFEISEKSQSADSGEESAECTYFMDQSNGGLTKVWLDSGFLEAEEVEETPYEILECIRILEKRSLFEQAKRYDRQNVGLGLAKTVFATGLSSYALFSVPAIMGSIVRNNFHLPYPFGPKSNNIGRVEFVEEVEKKQGKILKIGQTVVPRFVISSSAVLMNRDNSTQALPESGMNVGDMLIYKPTIFEEMTGPSCSVVELKTKLPSTAQYETWTEVDPAEGRVAISLGTKSIKTCVDLVGDLSYSPTMFLKRTR